jgi:hypothetical protein
MKKLIVSLVFAFGILTSLADGYLTGWYYTPETESITINVLSDEPWEIYRSYDNTDNFIKIASMKKHDTQYVDVGGVTDSERVFYYVKPTLKKNINPNKPIISWWWGFVWEQ